MNKYLMDYIDRKSSGRDYEDERRGRDRRDRRDRRDYEDERRGRDNRDNRDSRDYENGHDYEDERRMRDSRDYEDGRDYEDSRDYNKSRMRIRKSDMKHWKHNMENADGTRGEHYDMEQIMHAAEKVGVKFNDFSEKEFCLAVNMIYSDYCKVLKKHILPEKELTVCAELAKAFLDDADGPEPSEKLALYYYCIVDSE
jgi:hypothetical protein